jgi:hydroxyacylglutathione hydrolase
MSTTLDIVRIPVLNDNYVWLMREPQSGSVGVVDPAVAGPVLAEAAKRRCKITHVLNTHHHGDHVGGNREIKEATGCMPGGDPVAVFAEVRHRKDVFR